MTLQEFYNKWNGKYADYDGRYGDQCKDLFSYYNLEVVGNPNYVFGDAWQLYEACPKKYYKKVNNPQKGDIAIWEQYLGGYGHVAIVWDNGYFFSQNYPLDERCGLYKVPTQKLKGYLRPVKFIKNNYMSKLIQQHVDKTSKFYKDLANGVIALGFDKDRIKPYIIRNSHKKYYNNFLELLSSEAALWVSSKDADVIPNA